MPKEIECFISEDMARLSNIGLVFSQSHRQYVDQHQINISVQPESQTVCGPTSNQHWVNV